MVHNPLPVVYRVPLALDEEHLCQLEGELTSDELARANRFVVPEPRRQFIGCRTALRRILSHHLNCRAREIKFRIGKWGKPHLDGLHFNVSHSGDMGLIAVSTTPIGVDVETTHPRIQVKSLAKMLLDEAEQAAWDGISAHKHQEQILRLWVCKESLLKALGLGITECLQQVRFPVPIPASGQFKPERIEPAIQVHLDEDANCARNGWTDASTWSIGIVKVRRTHFAAVATQFDAANVAVYDFEWLIQN